MKVKVWKTNQAGQFWTPTGMVELPPGYEYLESGNQRLSAQVASVCAEKEYQQFVLMEKGGGQFSERQGVFVPGDALREGRRRYEERMAQERHYEDRRRHQEESWKVNRPLFDYLIGEVLPGMPGDYVEPLWGRYKYNLDKVDKTAALIECAEFYVQSHLLSVKSFEDSQYPWRSYDRLRIAAKEMVHQWRTSI